MAQDGRTGQRRPKAVLLYSGGLDSILAAELLRRSGVEVVLLRFHSIFFPLRDAGGYAPPCQAISREISQEMVALVQNPHYGLGRNANPCLDCKQMMYARAWQEAQALGADFIATGEVLGQRPMSQRREAFAQMERAAGLEGIVVRPLSGKLLPPTVPEKRGLLRREELLDIRGRSRKRQMALAAEWGIADYPTPAGGCKLTDPNYAARVLALRRLGCLSVETLRAARHGRFYELRPAGFALVGRDDRDNRALLADAPQGAWMLELAGRPGPLACVAGKVDAEGMAEACRLVIRHSRFKDLPPEAVRCLAADRMRQQWALEATG